uniref:Uncharacterized protein n=1 Tax=Anguilla anguilla TaxID=7936 RepID=A0A0E9V3B4_ANGAN
MMENPSLWTFCYSNLQRLKILVTRTRKVNLTRVQNQAASRHRS